MENKKKSDINVMLKEAAVLTVITLLAGLLLGFVHELTKDPIRLQQEKAVQEACKAVFPELDHLTFEAQKASPSEELMEELAACGVTIGSIYKAFDETRKEVGMVIEVTSSEGYGGNIVLYVGVTCDGILNDVSILSISETPGLGMQAEKVLLPQLHNKQVEQITYTKTGSTSDSEIDAISGATITTRAVTNAVNGALRMAKELRGGADYE